MKKDKVCIDKRISFLAIGVLVVIGFVVAVSQLSQTKTSTNSRANTSGTCWYLDMAKKYPVYAESLLNAFGHRFTIDEFSSKDQCIVFNGVGKVSTGYDCLFRQTTQCNPIPPTLTPKSGSNFNYGIQKGDCSCAYSNYSWKPDGDVSKMACDAYAEMHKSSLNYCSAIDPNTNGGYTSTKFKWREYDKEKCFQLFYKCPIVDTITVLQNTQNAMRTYEKGIRSAIDSDNPKMKLNCAVIVANWNLVEMYRNKPLNSSQISDKQMNDFTTTLDDFLLKTKNLEQACRGDVSGAIKREDSTITLDQLQSVQKSVEIDVANVGVILN